MMIFSSPRIPPTPVSNELVTLLIAQGRNKDGSQVAVKKLTKSSKQEKREFLEDVINLSKVQHKNLVKLRGFCVERKHRLLVYEYLEKKSLRQTLLGNLRSLKFDLVESYNSMGSIHCYDIGMLRIDGFYVGDIQVGQTTQNTLIGQHALKLPPILPEVCNICIMNSSLRLFTGTLKPATFC